MRHKLLIIRKTEDESADSKKTRDNLHRSLLDFFNLEYNTTLYEGLDAVSDAEYASADCVLVHLVKKDYRRLAELNTAHPQTALIIQPNTNDAYEEEGLHKAGRAYILPTPQTPDYMLEAINRAITETKTSTTQ